MCRDDSDPLGVKLTFVANLLRLILDNDLELSSLLSSTNDKIAGGVQLAPVSKYLRQRLTTTIPRQLE